MPCTANAGYCALQLNLNRINGTTIPLYDKVRQVYKDPVEIVSARSGPVKT